MGAPTPYPDIAGYELGGIIAEGGFSQVFRARNARTGQSAACKVIRTTSQTTKHEQFAIVQEIRIHSSLNTHRNILEFIGSRNVVPGSEESARWISGVYMLLEYADGGDLFDKIVPDVGVNDDVAHLYFNQLASGIEYIHSKGICHRDLKPENILLSTTGLLKISDFGLASVYMYKGQEKLLPERCGSLPYVAPELADLDHPYRGAPIDCWGLGVVLFTLLAGNTPWDEPTDAAPEFVRYKSGRIWKEEPWSGINEDAASLLKGLLTIDPNERMTIADMTHHPWFMRPSQLRESSDALALALSQPLYDTGVMDLAAPFSDMDVDMDGDMPMRTQFTQTLMLFSQTQSGVQHNPHLCRFYTSLPPNQILALINTSLESMGVRTKPTSRVPRQNERWVVGIKIGGYDARKEMFKGYIELEEFYRNEMEGSFVVMRREKGNPISWRQLWKALVNSDGVKDWVLRRS